MDVFPGGLLKLRPRKLTDYHVGFLNLLQDLYSGMYEGINPREGFIYEAIKRFTTLK